jgi:hypothetical protein
MGETSGTFLGVGNPVGRGAAFHYISDVSVNVPVKPPGSQDFVQELTGGADKGASLEIFLRAWSFPDDHQSGVPLTENNLLTTFS